MDASGTVVATIARRPDHRHFEEIHDLAVASDGQLAVLDGSDLLRYGAAGEPLGVQSLPDGTSRPSNIAYSGRWAVAGAWGAEVLLIDSKSEAVYSFVAQAKEGRSEWSYGFAPDGSKLWMVQHRPLRLHRFALP